MKRYISSLLGLVFLGSTVQADVVIVNQVDVVFSPQDVTVEVGDTVRWVHSGGTHDVVEGTDGTIDGDEAFNGPLDSFIPVFEVVFDAAFLAANPRAGNRYDYFCTPHFAFGMIGSVTVLDVVEVQQAGANFNPNELTIDAGQTVRWLWGSGNHTVTEGTDGTLDGDEAFHSLLTSSTSSFEVTFDDVFLAANPRAGNRYDYFCLPHFGFGMVGAVTVTSVSSEPGTGYCSGDGSGTACPCSNPGGAGEGCANDTGSGALLTGSGSASIGADDLVLSATNLPPGPGLFFQGNNAVAGGNGNPFGDGLRCAGNSVRRLEIRFANAGNSFTTTTTISIATGGAVSAGQTKRYQYWYRDAGTSPCSTLFNLSNGYEIDWGA